MFSRADKMILCLLSEKFAAAALASSSSFLASAARPILDSAYAWLYFTCGGVLDVKAIKYIVCMCFFYATFIRTQS